MDRIMFIRANHGHTVVGFPNGWTVCSCLGGYELSTRYNQIPSLRN